MEITLTNMNTEITNKALNKELTNIKRAVEAGNKASWTVAQAFHHIVIDELFATDFGSLGNLAQAIGISKSVISRNVNGYVIGSKLSLMHWTLASVIELLPICSKYPIEELNKMCQELQAEGVPSRNKVRDYVKALLTQDTAPAEDTEPTEEGTEIIGTQDVDELEELRAEVKALQAKVKELETENAKMIENYTAREEAHGVELATAIEYTTNNLTTFSIKNKLIRLADTDIAQIVEEYLQEAELDEA